MSQTILGIDLGSYSVKALRLSRHMQELQILDYVEEPLNPHARLTHEEQVRGPLEKIVANPALKADVVCVSFPGYHLSSRVVDLPFTSSKKISQVIDFEIEGQIPFSIEEILTDYCVLEHSANQSRALCVYTHEDLFKKYYDSMAALHLDPKYFGADITDLPAIAQIAMVPTEGYYAICDIGHNKTNVVIMKGKDLKYVRTIGIGGHHFTRAIQRAFNLNFEKADALKLARGKIYVRMDESDQVSRILNKVAVELASALRQTFLGASRLYDKMSIDAVYCCGGGSQLVGMMDFLSYYLRTNVLDLDVLTYVSHPFDDPEAVNKVIPQVLSTALRPIYSNRVPKINFRKGPYAFKQDIQFITSEMKAVIAFLCVIVVLGFFYYFYAGNFYAKKTQELDTRVADLVKTQFKELDVDSGTAKKGAPKKKINATTYLKAAQKKLNEIRSQFSTQEGGAANVLEVLQVISQGLPAKSDVNFAVKGFNFAEDFVRLDGSTNDTLNVEKIVESLQKTQFFAKVEPTDAQPKPGNVWDFSIKLEMKKEEVK